MSHSRQPRTDLPIRDMMTWYARGDSLDKIGKRLGCAGTTVRRHLKAVGVEMRPPGGHKEGHGYSLGRCDCEVCQAYVRGYKVGRRKGQRDAAREEREFDHTYGGLLP